MFERDLFSLIKKGAKCHNCKKKLTLNDEDIRALKESFWKPVRLFCSSKCIDNWKETKPKEK